MRILAAHIITQVATTVEVHELSEANQALARLRSGVVVGASVLQVASLIIGGDATTFGDHFGLRGTIAAGGHVE